VLGGDKTPLARRAFQKDPEWAAPFLWRNEFRSVLALYLRQRSLSLDDALRLGRAAESLFRGAEYHVEWSQVLGLVASSRCSAYDCEFVALARALQVPLVTSDSQILQEFPDATVSLEEFLSA
jgi:predicted nucleic acid-binding protein